MSQAMRAAMPGDAPALAALDPQFCEADLAADGARHVVVLEPGGDQLVACAATWSQGGQCLGLRLTIRPDWRGRGVGSRLLTHLLEDLRHAGADEVRVWLRERDARTERFYARHGFEPFRRTIQLHLELATAAAPDLAAHVARVADQGIRLVSLDDELGAGADPLRAWHAMVATAELPGLSYEAFLERAVVRWTVGGSCHFARLGDRYIGYGLLQLPCLEPNAAGDPGFVEQGYVRVLPGYRGRGLGLALSAQCVRYAQRRGYHTLWADVAETNLPSLAVKARLGYREVRREAWLRRRLR